MNDTEQTRPCNLPPRDPNAPSPAVLAKRTLDELKRELEQRSEYDRARITKRLNDVPGAQRITYLKAALGKASPRQAIKAFCAECVCWDRREVELCTAPACPLFQYRPWK